MSRTEITGMSQLETGYYYILTHMKYRSVRIFSDYLFKTIQSHVHVVCLHHLSHCIKEVAIIHK